MASRRYRCPILPAPGSADAPFPGAALEFRDPWSGACLPVFADAALTRPLAQPIMADGDGRFPEMHLDPRLAARVGLLAANGSTVASHLLQPGGTPASPDDAGLFRDLAALSPPRSVTRLRSEGWATAGLGAGDYVADRLATRELAARHPRFCAITANGRVFRLEATGGLLTVEQGGAWGQARGRNLVDDRAAFQAAIDYAAAIGVERVGLAQPGYSLWMSRRTSPRGQGLRATDGHALVVAPGQRLHLIGLAASRSRLSFRMPGGGSFDGEAPGGHFQQIGGKAWRGGGIYLHADEPAGAPGQRQALTLERVILDGGTRRSARGSGAAGASGWDVTHKGVWMAPDRKGADIAIIDCELTGWRGETVYAPNDPGATLTVRRSTFAASSGQGLNPNGCRVDIEDCTIRDCRIGIEGWAGPAGGRIVRTRIVDCRGRDRETGGAFALQGGVPGKSARSAYYAPTRGKAAADPVGTIDITCERCGPAHAGWWLKGRLTLIDTVLTLGEPWVFNEGAGQVALSVRLVTDRSAQAGIRIAGGKGKAGERLTDHLALTVTSERTAAAKAAGLRAAALVTWRGSLGSDVRVTLSGERGMAPPHATGPAPDGGPVIR